MSEILNNLLAQANEYAETSGFDMNEATAGGGGSRLLPAGYAFAQLVGYWELGNHEQTFNGKSKGPKPMAQLEFALTGAAADPEDPTKTIPYNNDDGTPYIMRPWDFAIDRNEKARAYNLFATLNWRKTAKNFAQLLGQKWLVKIVHEEKSKTDKTIVSRMDLESFLPPLDPVSRQPYNITDADPALYKLFLWDRPTQVGWDSLKIEGTFQREVDGKKVETSKNRIQEKILSAVNFQGSPLQLMLGGAVAALPEPVAAPVAPVGVPAAPLAVPAATPAPAVVAPAPAPVGVPAPAIAAVPTPVAPSSPALPA